MDVTISKRIKLVPALLFALLVSITPKILAATDASTPATERFTVVVLPDTQFYCDTLHQLSKQWGNGDLRECFFDQTRWIIESQERLNTSFVIHVGDIVQADAPEEWEIAKKAMSSLDNKVPYSLCLGNHDMGYQKTANSKYGFKIAVDRTTQFNTYFPREKFAKSKEFGGTFSPKRHDNSWYHFVASGMKFLVLNLEYMPRDAVLEWANHIVTDHPQHRVIINTHAYLNANGRRANGHAEVKGNSGEQVWQKLASQHENIFMVVCGHVSGDAITTSKGIHGNQVHQILCDFQGMHNGGESWLRYIEFDPPANQIQISTYNPRLDTFMQKNPVRLRYPMTTPKVSIDSTPPKSQQSPD